MRVLIVTVGSGGDVHPFLGIGRALQARGADVAIITNPHFAPTVAAAGIPLIPIGTDEEYLTAIRHPDLVHPIRGPMYVFNELVLTRSEEMYVLTRRTIREFKPDIVLRHHIAFGA
ncbi:MAG: glycosyltransferase, partial [Phycisphaerales bacterium]